MIFDYETLKVIWWGIIGVVIIGFAVTGGFDLGVGMLLPWVGKTDDERRVLLNSVGPTWEGNQTWFITAGGATFAAWPLVYSAAFSGLYTALLLLLFTFILRPVGFDYRSKLADPRWRSCWDWGLFIGGLVPALIFGVAFGNLLIGLPFDYDMFMRVTYHGGLLGLLNPFGLLAGLISVAMLLMHGASFLHTKTEGAIANRSKHVASVAAIVSAALFIAGGFWVSHLDGMRILTMPDANSAFVPAAKTVALATGAWLDNYARWPLLWALPTTTILLMLLCALGNKLNYARSAFIASGLAVTGIILTAGASLFPFIMPSTMAPNNSLTVWDAVSSHRTLSIMFWVTLVMVPIIVTYTSWVYRIMRGKVTVEHIQENQHSSY
ncbi:cytochrome d ubiquinol oxidase subunit II [Solimicrobium silvestre]|uniref:CydB: cytochrome d ubiquinol oxidase, subunit II n=1 Tax=Solimicrobium silvestre TaxID=2099400 RepID=A0A2S9H078_9BURK|nr:cytochrome d ubiquinol oxidase subunit II [Solimicrobium silvestre]PRC93381.1 cydB: cytochrome d ubiquinol oxidase, subunit II [Solimicrobium silvestre]